MEKTIFRFTIALSCMLNIVHLALTQTTIQPPTGVKASQGKYPDMIQIDWDKENSATYVIRRVDSLDNKQTTIMTPKPISTAKFSDREALPNRKYFYAVQKIVGTKQSAFSKPVVGYRALVAASHGKDTLQQQQQQQPELKLNLTIQHQTPDTFMVDKTEEVWFYLLNENSQSVEPIKLSFYLSTDNQLGDEDALLGETMLDSLAGNKSRRRAYPLSIKSPKSAGLYFLILSASVKDVQTVTTYKPIFLKLNR
jgi:hypothetical protein